MSIQSEQQQTQQKPRILSESETSVFVELSSQYTHPQWYQAVQRTEAGYFTPGGSVLYQFDSDGNALKLELSREEMSKLIASYLHFLAEFDCVQYDERLSQAFLAYMQAPEQSTLPPNSRNNFVSDDDLGDLDEAPF